MNWDFQIICSGAFPYYSTDVLSTSGWKPPIYLNQYMGATNSSVPVHYNYSHLFVAVYEN